MRLLLLPLLVWGVAIPVALGMEADLYLNKDKFGEFFKLEISEKGCTNVPLNWENQAVSVDTHGSCIKFYDLPYCKGKYVALQPYHGTFQDNLETLAFNKIISSASPCGPKVPTGRYYIQNGADGSVLTIETKNHTPVARAHPFKPYISKGQQFQLEKVALADYEIIPRLHQTLNPLTYDMTVSTAAHPVRRVWKIESVYRGRYIIKNEWSNRCLYKSDSGKVEEHECVSWSPNQEWIFRSIKVKPYFPSKEELNKKPIRPDDTLPFEPQDDSFSPIPYQPNKVTFPIRPVAPALPPAGKKPGKGSSSSKLPVQIQRPGPLVINPGEPFPPVFPYPILPQLQGQSSKNSQTKPPVPHVRHPGPLPFPAEPVVMDPKKPTASPLDFLSQFNIFGSQAYPNPAINKTPAPKEQKDKEEDNSNEDDQSDEAKESEENDEPGHHYGNGGPKRRPRPRPGGNRYPGHGHPGEDVEYGDKPSPGRPHGGGGHRFPQRRPPPKGNRFPEHEGDVAYDDEPGRFPQGDRYEEQFSDEFEDPAIRQKNRNKQEALAGVKYSDYRLHF